MEMVRMTEPNPRDVEREKRSRLADEWLAAMPGSAQLCVTDIQRSDPKLKTTSDVLFDALVCRAEKGAS